MRRGSLQTQAARLAIGNLFGIDHCAANQLCAFAVHHDQKVGKVCVHLGTTALCPRCDHRIVPWIFSSVNAALPLSLCFALASCVKPNAAKSPDVSKSAIDAVSCALTDYDQPMENIVK